MKGQCAKRNKTKNVIQKACCSCNEFDLYGYIIYLADGVGPNRKEKKVW